MRRKGVWVIESHNGGCVTIMLALRLARCRSRFAGNKSPRTLSASERVLRVYARRCGGYVCERKGKKERESRERSQLSANFTPIYLFRCASNPEAPRNRGINVRVKYSCLHSYRTYVERAEVYICILFRIHVCVTPRSTVFSPVRPEVDGLPENLVGGGGDTHTRRESTYVCAPGIPLLATRFSGEPRPPFGIVASRFLPESLARFHGRSSAPLAPA